MQSCIDEQFYTPRLPISIVALPDSDIEAYAMRALLEMFRCVVTIHWIGAPMDFLKVLGQGETTPRYLLITGHGDDENGYYLGEYAGFIDTSMLREQYMPAEAIAPVVNLPGCTVISSACYGGIEAMGHAFTANGKVNAYIGCRVAPNGDDICLFLVNYFYRLLRKKRSDHEAWQQAMLVVDQPEIYQMSYFYFNGVEERYEHIDKHKQFELDQNP